MNLQEAFNLCKQGKSVKRKNSKKVFSNIKAFDIVSISDAIATDWEEVKDWEEDWEEVKPLNKNSPKIGDEFYTINRNKKMTSIIFNERTMSCYFRKLYRNNIFNSEKECRQKLDYLEQSNIILDDEPLSDTEIAFIFTRSMNYIFYGKI